MNTLSLRIRGRAAAWAWSVGLFATLLAASAAETNTAFSYPAYRFTPDPKGEGTGRATTGVAEVVAAWNPRQATTVTLPVRGNKATLVNTVGEERVLEVTDGQAQFTLPAGKAVYVQEWR